MPAKTARSAHRPPFGAPTVTAVICAVSLSCQNQGKAPKFTRNSELSGESQIPWAFCVPKCESGLGSQSAKVTPGSSTAIRLLR